MNDLRHFWSEIGSQKNFTDPFYLEELAKYIPSPGVIVEYGCGYGRILSQLWDAGYRQLIGFDFAEKMLKRGRESFPHLDLRGVADSGSVDLPDESVDATILSTVLVCNPSLLDQVKIVDEMRRILGRGGVLYICEFLITNSDKLLQRYAQHAQPGEDDYGVYRTAEGTTVRHHTIEWVLNLLKGFDVVWRYELRHVTMNGNPVETVHLIARKI